MSETNANKQPTPPALASATLFSRSLRAALNRRAEYYRTAVADPHNINNALYVAMLEAKNAVDEAMKDAGIECG